MANKHNRGASQCSVSRIGGRRLAFSLVVLLMLIFLVTLVGCMPGTEINQRLGQAGFFRGVWHGWIAPFSLLAGLVNPAIRIYESDNTGWTYDFGFYIAVIGGFGSFSLIRRQVSSRKNRDD